MAGDIPPGTYTLQLGSTFSESKKDVKKYHSLRYDFKPQSFSNNEAETFIAFGTNGDCHVAVPTEGDNLMVYKGSQKEAKPKECLLFYDKKTGTVRLEKISSNINVKKTRESGGTTEAVLRTEMAKLRAAGTKKKAASPKPFEETQPTMDDSSSSSSSSDSDSDSGSDEDPSTATARNRLSSNSSMDDMESQLIASVNNTAPPPSRMDDMPSFDMPMSRPPPSQPAPQSLRPSAPPLKSSSHDHLGLNLSESSDDED